MKHFQNNAKEYLKMTEEDKEYRQGRSKRQTENNNKILGISVLGLLITILGIIIYGLITV